MIYAVMITTVFNRRRFTFYSEISVRTLDGSFILYFFVI
jgi:hypothetical protein